MPPSSSQSSEPAAAGAEVDLTDRTLGDFHLLRRLGQGGMGQVYLAEQLSLKRRVALKIMRADLAANVASLKRFQAEAEAIARVTHANIVQVYSVGSADGLQYMALEYVEGRNLKEYLTKKGPPDLLLALSIMRQVAAALERASELGIVHRDIKPENILVTRKGEVKVADFGLSRCLTGEQKAVHLTQTGVSMGTPLYMSPEQVQGQEIDPRTDIYSFGVTCYHMLTGEPPFRGQTPFEVAMQHVNKDPVPIPDIRPDLPPELCGVVHKMMAKEPAQRYQSSRELLKDLTQLYDRLNGLGNPLPRGSQSMPVAPPGGFASLSARTTRDVPRQRRRVLRGVLIAALIMLGLGGGAAFRWWKDRPAKSERHSPVLSSGQKERALLDDLKKPFDAQKPEELNRHLDNAIELGLLYLQQRKLKEATAFFKELQDAPPQGLKNPYEVLGRLGQAAVLAFQDDAKGSDTIFLALEKVKPPAGRINLHKETPQAQAYRLAREYPAYYLLNLPQVRRMVAEALDQNAANLPGKQFPEALEYLRKPPVPGRKPGNPL